MQRNGNGFYIPPGGTMGAQANTLAARTALIGENRRNGNGARRRARKSSARKSAAPARARRRAAKIGGRMKAGSAAAKAWGRKMKRLRG